MHRRTFLSAAAATAGATVLGARSARAQGKSAPPALERARQVRFSCTPIGVLIVWR